MLFAGTTRRRLEANNLSRSVHIDSFVAEVKSSPLGQQQGFPAAQDPSFPLHVRDRCRAPVPLLGTCPSWGPKLPLGGLGMGFIGCSEPGGIASVVRVKAPTVDDRIPRNGR